jgi:hypothetical protein
MSQCASPVLLGRTRGVADCRKIIRIAHSLLTDLHPTDYIIKCL